MAQNNPTISVVIPAYNGAKYIEQTLQSVLSQHYPPLEVLVVDDSSQDETVALVQALAARRPSLKLVQRPNGGVCAARNTGIRQAQGQYIALLDQDDLWLPDYLEQLAPQLEPNRIVTANYQRIDEKGQVTGVYNRVRSEEVTLPGILTSTHIFLSGSIFGRALWEKVGPFDETLVGAGAEDWDWFARAVLAGAEVKLVSGLLWQYRIHASNNTRNFKMMADNTERVLNKLFKTGQLPPHLQAEEPHAYYINYVIAAGKFLAGGDRPEAARYLALARQASPTEFFSLQTFISFLKIYAQVGLHDLKQTGEEAVQFVAEQSQTRQEQARLAGLGYVALALLLARRSPALVGRYLLKATQLYPAMPLEPGLYRTLARYSLIYLAEFANRLNANRKGQAHAKSLF